MNSPYTPEELFAMYVPLAGRVTHLRTILQSPSATITRPEAQAWVEDVKSIMRDYIELNDLVLAHLRTLPLPEAIPHEPTSLS